MAILVVCGVNENGSRDIITVDPMVEESEDSYQSLFFSFFICEIIIPYLENRLYNQACQYNLDTQNISILNYYSVNHQ